MATVISSTANARVKALAALRRRRQRDRGDVTVVEGREEVRLAIASGVVPREFWYCAELGRELPSEERERFEALGTEVVLASEAVFDRIAYRESPDGWLAVVPALDTGLDRLVLGDSPLVVVCESVEKPGNLGAILRTADGAGVDAVVSADPLSDWGNPNVVRASKGTVFSVPVAEAATAEVVTWLRERGIAVVVATPEASEVYTDVDLTGAVAIVVGTENAGVSDAFRAAADVRVAIPMRGRAVSLNVATSAALLVYEAVRQRAAR